MKIQCMSRALDCQDDGGLLDYVEVPLSKSLPTQVTIGDVVGSLELVIAILDDHLMKRMSGAACVLAMNTLAAWNT